jgi:hypothetical protein
VPIPLDCPGSLIAVSGLRLRVHKVRCDFCDREVVVRPPPDGLREPWEGLKAPCINAYWSNPMREAKPGN